jgi:hypothetical protein
MTRAQESFSDDDGDADGAVRGNRPAYRGDPERVRMRLQVLLSEARAAETLPWSEDEARLYRTVFPQMSLWLPEEEASQLCAAFEAELARLRGH